MLPDEIRNQSFPTVRRGGLAPADVKAYLGAVASEVTALQAKVRSLTTELEQAREAAEAGSADPLILGFDLGERVTSILESAEREARVIIADAQAYAERTCAEADSYSERIQAEADARRREAEIAAETHRHEAVQHAMSLRAETEDVMERIRTEAEVAMQRTQDQVTAELKQRTKGVRDAERQLVERLRATARDVQRSLERFEDVVTRHEQGSDAELVGETPDDAPDRTTSGYAPDADRGTARPVPSDPAAPVPPWASNDRSVDPTSAS